MKDHFIKEQIKFLFLLFLIFFLFKNYTNADENKILFRVNNEIITSFDIDNEIRYLLALNPNLNNLNQKDIIQISKNSILKEKIKKLEIDKLIEDKTLPNDYLEQLLKNIYLKIGMININEFKQYLETKNIPYQNVLNKITIEALWNEIIISKYSSKIKIDRDELRKEIEKNKNKDSKSYLMSEIFFEINENEDLNIKYKEIKNTINQNGFNNAALKYSISQTSNIGGKLNWIDQNSINKKIRDKLKDLKINEHTDPIRVAGGFLILQINEIKVTKSEINMEKELKKMIRSITNDQLNQFSKIYFNKVKKNIIIDEI